MTTSIRMRSGLTVLALTIASSPLSLATTSYPAFVSMSFKTCRSVGESSTIKIFLMLIVLCPSLWLSARATPCSADAEARLHRALHVRGDCFQQALLGERLGQILVRANHAAARAVEQPVLRRQHHHGRLMELDVFLDQSAGLIAIQPRHHDIDKYQVRLMVCYFGERIETVVRQNYRTTRLQQKDLGAPTDRVAIVDHHDFHAVQSGRFWQVAAPWTCA